MTAVSIRLQRKPKAAPPATVHTKEGDLIVLQSGERYDERPCDDQIQLGSAGLSLVGHPVYVTPEQIFWGYINE